MELRLDLHIHSERSPDGRMPLAQIVARCRAAGLNGCAVCDHDIAPLTEWEDPDFLLIAGTEISTDCGHLLGLFLREPIATRDFSAACAAIHAQGGLAVLAHPFEHHRDLSRIEPLLDSVDGIEVWNSRATRKIRDANSLALSLASAHRLRRFAGSDAHLPQEIGSAVLTVQAASLTPADAREALLRNPVHIQGRISPARYTAMSQLTRRRKLGSSPAAYLKWGLFAAKCAAQDVIRKGASDHVYDC